MHETATRPEINGVGYQVHEAGAGERTVVLLHGMPDTGAVWRHQIGPLVEAGFRVICPDMLGYGGTDKPAYPARYAGEHLLTDLLALFEALGLTGFDLVGHDWGAFLSWELAINVPDLIHRHVTVSVGHPGTMFADFSPQSLKRNWYMYLNACDGAADLYRHDDVSFFIDHLIPTHPEPEEVRSRLRDPEAMRGMLNWDRGNPMAALFLAYVRGELPAAKCTVPTLGIWSSGDEYLLEEHMLASEEFMAAPWRYVRIDGASHWPMLDRPQLVNELLLDWLRPA